jgi:hypothetical protein
MILTLLIFSVCGHAQEAFQQYWDKYKAGQKGYWLHKEHHYAESIEFLKKGIEVTPGLYSLLADTYYRVGDYQTSIFYNAFDALRNGAKFTAEDSLEYPQIWSSLKILNNNPRQYGILVDTPLTCSLLNLKILDALTRGSLDDYAFKMAKACKCHLDTAELRPPKSTQEVDDLNMIKFKKLYATGKLATRKYVSNDFVFDAVEIIVHHGRRPDQLYFLDQFIQNAHYDPVNWRFALYIMDNMHWRFSQNHINKVIRIYTDSTGGIDLTRSALSLAALGQTALTSNGQRFELYPTAAFHGDVDLALSQIQTYLYEKEEVPADKFTTKSVIMRDMNEEGVLFALKVINL